MNLPQVLKTLKKETNDMIGRMERYALKFKKDLLSTRMHTYPFRKVYNAVTPQKLHMYVAFQADKRSDWKNPYSVIGGTYILDDGQYGFVVVKGYEKYSPTTTFFIMTPHFLKRYRERVMENTTISTDALIKEFIKKNTLFSTKTLSTDYSLKMEKYQKDETEQLVAIMPDGICICEKYTHDCILMKTFITNDLLSDSQKAQLSKDTTRIENFLAMEQLRAKIDKDATTAEFNKKIQKNNNTIL